MKLIFILNLVLIFTHVILMTRDNDLLDVPWNVTDFNDFYENYVLSNNDNILEREIRKNEFVPFNSLTFKKGGLADEKYKSKLKIHNDSHQKIEWWKRQKNKKKKKPDRKKRPPEEYYQVTTTTPPPPTTTTTPTTTWFPISTTKHYFSRPLDYQKPIKSKISWWKESQSNKKNTVDEEKPMRSRLPTLTEVFN